MKRMMLLTLAILSFGFAPAIRCEVLPDGTIIRRESCPPKKAETYEEYVAGVKSGYARAVEGGKRDGITLAMPADFSRRTLSRKEFERRAAYKGVECERIVYISDGLKVAGYIWRPKESSGKKLPLIIFNRGGNQEHGRLSPWMASGFYYFVSRGYVVIGSQYRGNDGGDGKEEYGGADVRDVLNLIPLARSLPYVDMKNVFMLGSSRGGMMTYLALKNGVPINAAAVNSGVTDLAGNSEDHPLFVDNIYRPLIPDFDKRRIEAMKERSVVAWVEKMNTPILILHGASDERISAVRTLAFAQKLQALGKTYELVIYAEDDHGLSLNTADRDRRTLEWFEIYRK